LTSEAVTAAAQLYDELFSVLDALAPHQWDWPSNCPGWRVRDVIAHLGAAARQGRDPLPAMPVPPAGLARERQHDYEVTRRKDWPVPDVLDELRTYLPRNLRALDKLQHEPAASQEIDLPGLGRYPGHALANASAFDAYCHLHLDLAPILGRPPANRKPPHATLYAVVQWMLWGLPQMQGPLLAETVGRPITLQLTGPGSSTWTVQRSAATGELLVTETDEGTDVTVTSTAADFVRWATKRAPWQPSCAVTGDRSDVVEFLGTLDII
jgi:uncharacterized protein (TIGR03083 family)